MWWLALGGLEARNLRNISTEREGYARSLEGKGIEWDGVNNVEHMWEQVKWAMVENAREVYGSVRVGGKKPECVVEQ